MERFTGNLAENVETRDGVIEELLTSFRNDFRNVQKEFDEKMHEMIACFSEMFETQMAENLNLKEAVEEAVKQQNLAIENAKKGIKKYFLLCVRYFHARYFL